MNRHRRTGRNNNKRPNEKGIALVTVAALLLLLIGMIALGVDIGVLYSARTSSQQAVDAAALGGAFTFISNPTAPQPATAIAHATEIAVNNGLMSVPVDPADVSVTVDIPNQRVTVDLETVQPTFFARVLSIDSATVGTRGVAEAGRGSGVGGCPKPWFIPNTMVSLEEPCDACAAGQTLINPSTGAVTEFARSALGSQVLIAPQSPHSALAPSQFYAIDFTEQGGGANEYRQMIGSCAPPVVCQEVLDVLTGNMVGPTQHGVRDLIGEPARDLYVDVGHYLIDGHYSSDLSDSLVIAPVWDVCGFPGFCPGGQFPSGTNVGIEVAGFALVFVEGFQAAVSGPGNGGGNGGGNGPGNGGGNGGGSQGNLVGRLINVGGCMPGGAGPTGSEVFSFPLRLVRLPD